MINVFDATKQSLEKICGSVAFIIIMSFIFKFSPYNILTTPPAHTMFNVVGVSPDLSY